MKKLALLLSVIMLLTCLGACVDKGETSDTSDETSNNSVYNTQPIDALYKAGVDRDKYDRTNLSVGCSYTFSRDASDALPDDGSKLTDGSLCSDVTDESEYMKYVGFVGRKELSITVDLGSVETNLSDFSITSLSSDLRSAVLPRSVVFSVSSDSTNFVDIGTVYRPENNQGNLNYEFCLRLNGAIEARYVRITVPKESIITLWMFLDELGVYRYDTAKKDDEDDTTSSDTYYKNPTFPAVTEPEYWDSSESDYNNNVNLLLNTEYSISPVLVIPDTVLTDYYNTQPSGGQLTDGRIGSSSWSDSAYMHFTNGSARIIIFDLEKTSSAESFMISFFVETDYGIKLPATVTVFASEDGEGWQKLSQQALSGLTSGRHEFKSQFENATKARFIKVIFDTATHVWCDEIRVYGTKNTAGALDVVPNEEETRYPNEYLSLDALGGSENILLAYNFRVENPSVGLTSKDEYLPYVAYYDTKGNMKD
ncbi:MAG TPA: hypothetical protein PLT66_06050, partial [Bacillota bacterium]|nr:hypothetical protein [Bacillota bacterium]